MESVVQNFQTTHDESIMEYLKAIKNRSANLIGLQFHLSRLMPYNRTPQQVHKAFQDLLNVFSALNGKTFYLRNDDFICIVERPSLIQLERCISYYKRAFSTDPLIANNLRQEKFYTQYSLASQFKDFYDTIFEIEKNETLRSSMTLPPDTLSNTPLLIEGIKVETLNLLQNILLRSDLSNHLRRQQICWYDGKMEPKVMSNHFYFSLKSIQETLNIIEPIEGNMWLFRQLTCILDRQMLKHLREIFEYKTVSSIHVNLSLRTIITSHFQALIREYHKQKSLTFGIDLIDALVHADAMFFSYNYLKERNAYVVLSGIEASLVDYLKLETLTADSFKLNWSPGFEDKINSIKKLVDHVGNERVILHKCDSEEAINAGLKAGIRLYQGRRIDILLRDKKKKTS